MESLSMIGALAGGVGLFLLGMSLMTDGLKLAAGAALKRILRRSTETRLRGLATGVLVTAFVQSSSAVTVATIGFVNAGLLTLAGSMWVLFGANVGTTITGWLVALVGLKFKIEVLALPLIAVGMLLRLTGNGGRRGGVGTALAGFGVLFLGIEMLQGGFVHLSADVHLPQSGGVIGLILLLLIGVGLTVLMQSSSAALAIVLTAAQSGLIATDGAAAMVIGANVGTTVTAFLASIGATPNAKRAAAAHILFNVWAALVAIALLPILLFAVSGLQSWLQIESTPAAALALFHTIFNVLGVVLIWPLAPAFARFLQARFRTAEEDEAQPRYLDQTVLQVPALALDALEREVRRLGAISLRMLRRAEIPIHSARAELGQDSRIAQRLNQVIADYIAQVGRLGMSPESARRLPQLLRVARYYEVASELVEEVAEVLAEQTESVQLASASHWRHQMQALLPFIDPHGATSDPIAMLDQINAFEAAYQQLKQSLLAEGASSRMAVVEMDLYLHAASAMHRAYGQMIKAVQLMADWAPLQEAEEQAEEVADAGAEH
jgi:phosphate:Na+ symporter